MQLTYGSGGSMPNPSVLATPLIGCRRRHSSDKPEAALKSPTRASERASAQGDKERDSEEGGRREG